MANEKLNGANNDVLTVKVNVALREDFRAFCKERGVSISAAVNMFVHALMKTNDFSFNKMVPDAKYLPASGAIMGIYLPAEVRTAFVKYCAERGAKMSTIVRSFMVNCVQTGKLWMPEGNLSE